MVIFVFLVSQDALEVTGVKSVSKSVRIRIRLNWGDPD